MHAYFNEETGALVALSSLPRNASGGMIHRMLNPDGDLVRRIEADISRFRLRDGKIEELAGWEVVDTRDDDLWAAVQELNAEYAVKMAGTYRVDDSTEIPLSAAADLANLATLAPAMVATNQGDRPAGVTFNGQRIRLTWAQIAEHAGPYAAAVADVQSWYQEALESL